MRLMLDTSKVAFTVTKAPEPRKDFGKDAAEGGPEHRPPGVGCRGARHGLRARGGDPGHGGW